ncbi:hypothetical protein [Actinacidiphila sp. ITFR-21]|uniref:hypothetical protein n=1 Tax=Actinacidiphila sp. ITFR-21 TaxID=3075199 RepID=UPI0028896861|nr:hypothetical protein [Streptomyces sp. ITFR-21]WNI16906.1 hypothetical protein RLT57_16180 [Streptomyces sp. ITFR-21]
MPRSVFMGRVVQPGEPLWLPDDRAWALALAQVEADRCPDCGTEWGDATAPENEFEFDAEVIRCHACKASATRVKAFQDGGGNPAGLHVHIKRRKGV